MPMLETNQQKRLVSLRIISALCIGVIILTVLQYARLYCYNPYAGTPERLWYLIMIALQLPILAGVIAMCFSKKIGLWLFLLGKILFFALPGMAGVDVMGLLTPVFFIESATFFILFARRMQYMSRGQ